MNYVWYQATHYRFSKNVRLNCPIFQKKIAAIIIAYIIFLKFSFSWLNILTLLFGLLNIFIENTHDLICQLSIMQLQLSDCFKMLFLFTTDRRFY